MGAQAGSFYHLLGRILTFFCKEFPFATYEKTRGYSLINMNVCLSQKTSEEKNLHDPKFTSTLITEEKMLTTKKIHLCMTMCTCIKMCYILFQKIYSTLNLLHDISFLGLC